MTSPKRIVIIASTAAAIAAGTLFTAAPAHASRSEECNRLLTLADWHYRMHQWYSVFYGADHPKARGHMGASQDAADFWATDCW